MTDRAKTWVYTDQLNELKQRMTTAEAERAKLLKVVGTIAPFFMVEPDAPEPGIMQKLAMMKRLNEHLSGNEEFKTAIKEVEPIVKRYLHEQDTARRIDGGRL